MLHIDQIHFKVVLRPGAVNPSYMSWWVHTSLDYLILVIAPLQATCTMKTQTERLEE